MRYLLLGLFKIYQMIPGPWHNACRHIPTCSNYAITALIEHEFLKGVWLSTKRIIKCNPWGTSGIDLVPKRREKN